ncbi:hypothetical protein [Fusobacterium necrophorum]|uniref:hypothetical protein n=1 Tax=Fusobacterium necrophorum TaxID=859 RepID=UPI00254C04F4|nr:hypothetical protein [Fusobacterium necrophorum]MDK4469424.1 hypothetical protein [Fusobacterium necrophorum]MDK4471869.1 hypothetical protein [Fusobacterium necrophorum]MDK4478169.1 hypothetical protein [Fusobacterium necrophorum]MDK4509131.1 hypothetical protein [Fusobacterium necrophorum]MDK4517604.1 hypothetical protein [Fusobacterium necrophorum]
MKKHLYLGISFLALSGSLFAIDGVVKFGFVSNAGAYNGRSKSFENYAPNLAAEIRQGFVLGEVGAGIAYNGKVGNTGIATVPVYGLLKWNVLPVLPIKPYIVGRVGRILKTNEDVRGSDPSGRGYYTVGAGMEIMNLEVEASYSATKIRHDHRGKDWLNQVSLGVGYKLF